MRGLEIVRIRGAAEAPARAIYHGEKVAFGTLVQLVLEDAATAEIEEVIGFSAQVGLPVTLAQVGLPEPPPGSSMPSWRRTGGDGRGRRAGAAPAESRWPWQVTVWRDAGWPSSWS